MKLTSVTKVRITTSLNCRLLKTATESTAVNVFKISTPKFRWLQNLQKDYPKNDNNNSNPINVVIIR